MKKIMAVLATIALTMVSSVPVYAGQWMQDSVGWWWQDNDGTYPKNWSRWLDGNQDGTYELYYFDENGYLYTNTVLLDGTTPVDANGTALGPDGRVLTENYDPDAYTLAKVEERQAEKQAAQDAWQAQIDAGINLTGKADIRHKEGEESIRNLGVYELSYRIAEEINQVREEHGLEPLVIDDELMDDAMERAEEAAERYSETGRLSHLRPDGSRAGTIVEQANYGVGENLYLKAISTDSDISVAKEYVKGWMASSGHRRNILKEGYTETGVGSCVTDDGIIVSQLFVVGTDD